MTATTIETHALDVPGARLTYDVRGDLDTASPERPVLMMVGSPMGAAGFATLASYFTDRPVVTYDPRGVERSVRTDEAPESTPEQHGDDLHRLIETLGAGPVDLLASSGGAVNALALVTAHPEQVRTLVAHEPPLTEMVPDAEQARAAVDAIHDAYQREGLGLGMAKFIAVVSHAGPIDDEFAARSDPDPGMFGLPTVDDGSRDDVLLGQNLRTCTGYHLDVDTLATASTRIVIAVGQESEGELAHRAGEGTAERLGLEPVTFPSDHGGFLGGEYGQTGDPEGFAARLRGVLDAAPVV